MRFCHGDEDDDDEAYEENSEPIQVYPLDEIRINNLHNHATTQSSVFLRIQIQVEAFQCPDNTNITVYLSCGVVCVEPLANAISLRGRQH